MITNYFRREYSKEVVIINSIDIPLDETVELTFVLYCGLRTSVAAKERNTTMNEWATLQNRSSAGPMCRGCAE